MKFMLTAVTAVSYTHLSNDIQERTADGLICKRPAGNTYKIQDVAWALDFYLSLIHIFDDICQKVFISYIGSSCQGTQRAPYTHNTI